MSVEADEVPRRGYRRERKLERNLIEGPHMIELAAADVSSTDPDRLLQFSLQFRELLSTEFKPPIDEDVKSDLLPCFVQFLGRDDVPQLQSEAAWILGEIASGTPNNSLLITDLGAVPTFVKLLGSESDVVREEAVQALVRISCAYSKCLDDELLQPPHRTFLKEVAPTVLRRVPFIFSGFFEGSCLKRHAALMVMKGLLKSKDDGILENACYGLHFCLSRGTRSDLQAVIDAEFCPTVVELLRHPSSSVHIPALYVVVHMTWDGGDAETQAIVGHGVLASLKGMLINTHEDGTKKAVCFAISKITARSNKLIGAVVEEDLIPLLVGLAKSDEYFLKKAAIEAIANATLHGSHENISRIMVRDGGMRTLCDMLIGHGPWISQTCLDGLEHILKTGESKKAMGLSGDVNEYAGIIANIGGLKKIREMKNWPPISGVKFGKRVARILRTYWGEEVEEALAGGVSLRFSVNEHPASRSASGVG